jgi:N-methylhydantoinase B
MSLHQDRDVDPVRFEMYMHRLVSISEEGRIALQRVCASPIVVQGGECMSAFYAADGTTIHTASGHLRFAAGCEDAVKAILDAYPENPGIHDGDQFYLNDPYVASTHVYDQMIVKPIFHDKKLIAWTASMTHTADTGGILRGGSTEIFHEGVRTSGIKLVEGGVLRKDIFNILTEQCRDPNYVGLDLKSRIAANNVCARGFMQLVEKYGIDFINAANRKLIADSETMAQARLRSLPDGVWRSIVHASATNVSSGDAKPIRVVCTMTKRDDGITFDFDGSSAQNEDAGNMTLVGAWGQLFVALSSQLFWNIPWNGGMARPVTMKIPEGTFLNCRYPAACGDAPAVGGSMTAAASECIAKMLYAAGLEDDVNASWYGSGGAGESSNNGGPGFFYGGHNQHGLPVGQGLYDMHGSGFGAAPYRDGVSTGGHMNNPSVGISDIENIELQYPLVYLSRNHLIDSGGFGKYRGGLGLQRIIMVYGTSNLTVNYSSYHGIPGGWGLFGGYPMGVGGHKFVTESRDLKDKMKETSRYPVAYADVRNWGTVTAPKLPPLQRLKIPEFYLIADPVGVGSGYGDPLDRVPDMVLQDILNFAVSPEWAAKVYGVVVTSDELPRVSDTATQQRRAAIRKQRLSDATAVTGGAATVRANPDKTGNRLRRIHEYVEVAKLGSGRTVMRCCKCAHVFGPATENYKNGAVRRVIDFKNWLDFPLPNGGPFLAEFHEYFCPGCATQIAVETHCPSLEAEAKPVWDIRLDLEDGGAKENVSLPEDGDGRKLMTAVG